MKRELACLLALCAFTAAMVPRERRDAEDGSPVKTICGKVTPCRWVFRFEGRDDRIVENTYCECAKDDQCVLFASEPEQSTYEYRCKKQP